MTAAALLLLLLLPAPSASAEGVADAAGLETGVRRLVETLNVLERRLAEPFNPSDALYRGALPAMVRTLDPHSAFLDPEQFESLREMQRSTETGFGSVVSLSPGRVTVLQTLPESPSAKSGMAPGDEIVVLNGYQLAHLGVEQLVGLLSQARRQKVEVLVKRPSFPRLIPLTLVPEELADKSVPLSFFPKEGFGYVKVKSFEGKTDQELREAIESLGGDRLKGLVLDLRDNPGGLIEAAVRMAAMFLEPGSRILWIQGRDGPREEVRVPEGIDRFNFPMAVLIDEKTASAAELVTGALQDHDRAVVVGAKSFGKGLVQSVFDLSEGAGLALTTALYLSPSGRPIQKPWDDCRDYQYHSCAEDDESGEFFSDSGRELASSGGGITPDRVVQPRGYSRFELYLVGSGAILDFARDYVRRVGDVPEDFEVDAKMLDDFQFYLSRRGARVSISEWTAASGFIRRKLLQEIFNLSLGVDRGDQVELEADPLVRAALAELERRRADR